MTIKSGSIAALALAIIAAGDALAAPPAPEAGRWLTSWYAAPQAAWDHTFILPMNVPDILDNQSLQETVRLSAGGRRLRLVFSNRYGREPLTLGEVRVQAYGAPHTSQTLAFSGKPGASIAPGAVAISDPLALDVAPLSKVTVTSYLPSPTPVSTFHWGAQQTTHIAGGNLVRAAAFPKSGAMAGRLFLSAVMVEAAFDARTVVVLGDSITDGNGSTPEANRRWPDFLAERLAPHGMAVANAGISGARLLRDGMGQNALARFAQDVLSQPGVSDVIVLLGTNDIGWPGGPFALQERAVTLDDLTTGFRQLVAAAHARGIRITAGTLPPFEGALEGTPYAGHYSLEKERVRQQLNHWILSAGEFDAVVDFDAVLRDPARPQRMLAAFDSGDHLHPGDAGYRAMAAAVKIARLRPPAHPRPRAPE
jgi:lysophospholipase L1-like esterase